MLDLFSGLGGASSAFRDRGWTVITVDADPALKPDIVADLCGWHWAGGPVDLLWASPPCTEFSRWSMPWFKKVIPDMRCVQAVYRLVAEIRPTHWILENVKGAVPWLGPPAQRFGAVYLWGEFPLVLANDCFWKERLSGTQPALRAKVPYELSDRIAASITP